MNGWAIFFIILLLLSLTWGAWCIWHFYSAKRQGLPPPPTKSYFLFMSSSSSSSNYPAPRPSGPLDWLKDQFSRLSNRRTAQGAYEGTGIGGGGGGRARGARGLEDDAWDTRVGNEDPYGAGLNTGGYYNEEQELGLAPTPGYVNEPYGGRGGAGGDYLSQNTGYGAGMGSGQRGHLDDPFGDQHQAPSLRSVSPRPVIDTSGGRGHRKDNASLDSGGSSPTSVRKSVFREGI